LRKHKNAKKFAKMFLNAVGVDDAPRALEEVAVVKALMGESDEIRSMLASPVFTVEERDGAIKTLGEKLNFSESTVRFIKFLSAEGAIWALGDILDKAVAIYLEMKARVKATIITSVEIGSEYEARLKESLKKITNKDVDIEYALDPSLLGGMLVKVGSTMFDGSIRGQLRLLREELIKG
jgi:ATP synthase F1 delta subunit